MLNSGNHMGIMHVVRAADAAASWAIIEPTIRAGETYSLARDMSETDAIAYWMGPDRDTFIMEENEAILGTYYLRTNQMGGGRHICNCGYMTRVDATGRGIARLMYDHSVVQARSKNYRAMQFNFVMSANKRAIRLWQSVGFAIVGRVPGAFLHPAEGFVDTLVMFKSLEDTA